MFFCSGFLGVCVGDSCFASLSWGGGFSSLETVTSEVSEPLTVETLYSPHVPLLPLFPNVPFSWGEGWHGCLVSLIRFWAAIVFCFCYVGPSSVSRGVHGIWITFLVQGGPGVVKFRRLLVSGDLFLSVVTVYPFHLSLSRHSFPIIVVAGAV